MYKMFACLKNSNIERNVCGDASYLKSVDAKYSSGQFIL